MDGMDKLIAVFQYPSIKTAVIPASTPTLDCIQRFQLKISQ